MPGWRGAIASVSKEKAAELRGQVAAIAEASRLGAEVRVRSSPYPGRIETATGSLEVLSSDRTAGHSSSFDLVLIDETGLMPERARELLAGLRSSVSGKGGRIVHISVRGDSPLFAEVLGNPATVARIYAAPDGCAIDDRKAWAAANPGLGTIKQVAYMAHEVNRIRAAPADEPSFRAFDLNQALSPTREMICSPDDLRRCFRDDPPEREGRCFLGFDFGEATSSTAACAIWPATGRLETWQAFGDVPSLTDRGKRDSSPYVEMERRGELRTYPGRIVRPEEFLSDLQTISPAFAWRRRRRIATRIPKCAISSTAPRCAGRSSFAASALAKTAARTSGRFSVWFTGGSSAWRRNLSLATAIAKSTLRRDANGNPGLDRRRRAAVSTS